jgi:hypothetical protein
MARASSRPRGCHYIRGNSVPTRLGLTGGRHCTGRGTNEKRGACDRLWYVWEPNNDRLDKPQVHKPPCSPAQITKLIRMVAPLEQQWSAEWRHACTHARRGTLWKCGAERSYTAERRMDKRGWRNGTQTSQTSQTGWRVLRTASSPAKPAARTRRAITRLSAAARAHRYGEEEVYRGHTKGGEECTHNGGGGANCVGLGFGAGARWIWGRAGRYEQAGNCGRSRALILGVRRDAGVADTGGRVPPPRLIA